MPRRLLAVCAALVCLVGTRSLAADTPKQKAAKLTAQVPVSLDYLIYLPKDYETKDAWPLLLFLHGAGERGDDVNLVKKHGPPKLIEEGKDFPLIVVSPQSPKDRTWQNHELTALLDEIAAKNKIDKDRVYVSGLSMGGFGTWALAAYTPERFAGIIPICGGGEVIGTRRLLKMPIWVFHGAKDPIVPLKRSQDLVDSLKSGGNDVKFTIYPDALHDSWTATYNDPQVWKWLLEQKRKPADATAAAK